MGIAGEPVQVRNHDGAGVSGSKGPFLRRTFADRGVMVIEAPTLEEASQPRLGNPLRGRPRCRRGMATAVDAGAIGWRSKAAIRAVSHRAQRLVRKRPPLPRDLASDRQAHTNHHHPQPADPLPVGQRRRDACLQPAREARAARPTVRAAPSHVRPVCTGIDQPDARLCAKRGLVLASLDWHR